MEALGMSWQDQETYILQRAIYTVSLLDPIKSSKIEVKF